MTTNKVVPIIILLLVLVSLSYQGWSLLNQIACEGQPINNNVTATEAQQIFGDRLLAQSFTAPRPDLNRLDIFFQTYGRRNTHDVTLSLYETNDPNTLSLDGPLYFQGTFNATEIWDQSWRSFYFDPLPDSAGKSYLIVLTSPESTDGNAITVGGIERNSYLPGTAFLGPDPVPADITFRSCYQMPVGEKLVVLANQLTHDRAGLWGQPAFYGIMLVLYGLTLIGFLRLLFKQLNFW